ncbi:unnamed protein product [Phytophthora fragariaefolia]|uniref:Unnamed protein product n=1 Tax=Phytophthora fragariaefolia TaxID=1490495 RepID=A0A9W6XCX9_9STRA|nr:unnamed protein product [Phytophthora fragariaefolia]
MEWTRVSNTLQEWLVADEVAWTNRCSGAIVAVLALIITAPIREVACGACGAVFGWIGDGLWLLRACVERFVLLVRRVNFQDYHGVDHGWAELECVFVAPIVVLAEHKDYYGLFGQSCVLWCQAWQHSVCDYLPDSSTRKWEAVKELGANSVSATAASWKRWCNMLVMVCSLVRITLAVIVFGPSL